MQTHTFLVFTRARPGQEKAFDDWYTNIHLPQVVAVPGVISAQRFGQVARRTNADTLAWDYAAIYEIEAGRSEETIAEIFARMDTEQMVMSDAMDPEYAFATYAPITPVLKR
ncbi:MAG: hypothetical protein VYD90_16875 [Pseudomonadota bacterium]|nr:hypothetical protein [Pseudomonadota bacterium]